ncbi:hypothetical protein BDR03DRAFT_982574 [Suillus americanus]|nr:hypothetical protein BDR03DRAFT_982574 [Suillus americanus]
MTKVSASPPTFIGLFEARIKMIIEQAAPEDQMSCPYVIGIFHHTLLVVLAIINLNLTLTVTIDLDLNLNLNLTVTVALIIDFNLALTSISMLTVKHRLTIILTLLQTVSPESGR